MVNPISPPHLFPSGGPQRHPAISHRVAPMRENSMIGDPVGQLRFGAGPAVPEMIEKNWSRYQKWKNRLLTWVRAHWESLSNSISTWLSQGILGVAAFAGTMPFPQFLLNRLNERFFFSPRKVSSKELLQNPFLQKSAQQHHFYSSNHDLLCAWHIEAKGDKPTVLFSHGRDCNISHQAAIMDALQKKGYGVFVYDYPGFGRSEGRPSEEGLYDAARCASRYLAGKSPTMRLATPVPAEKQILMGHSLGGGVAVNLARELSAGKPEERPKALVLINTFTDIKEPFRERLASFRERVFPLSWLARNAFNLDGIPFRFDSKSKIRDVKMPILILHGKQDTVISDRQGIALHQAASETADKEGRACFFLSLPNATHNLHPDVCKTAVETMEQTVLKAALKHA